MKGNGGASISTESSTRDHRSQATSYYRSVILSRDFFSALHNKPQRLISGTHDVASIDYTRSYIARSKQGPVGGWASDADEKPRAKGTSIFIVPWGGRPAKTAGDSQSWNNRLARVGRRGETRVLRSRVRRTLSAKRTSNVDEGPGEQEEQVGNEEERGSW